MGELTEHEIDAMCQSELAEEVRRYRRREERAQPSAEPDLVEQARARLEGHGAGRWWPVDSEVQASIFASGFLLIGAALERIAAALEAQSARFEADAERAELRARRHT